MKSRIMNNILNDENNVDNSAQEYNDNSQHRPLNTKRNIIKMYLSLVWPHYY